MGVPVANNLLFAADGNLTLAVPEPSSYAMLLAGLGFVGFATRRKLERRRLIPSDLALAALAARAHKKLDTRPGYAGLLLVRLAVARIARKRGLGWAGDFVQLVTFRCHGRTQASS